MKLLFSKASPYARKVRVFAQELGIAGDIDWVESHPFEDHAELTDANPNGRVPTLIVGQQAIFDSTLICQYFQSLLHTPQFNHDDQQYWQQQVLLNAAHGLIDIAVCWRKEQMRDEERLDPFWLNRYQQQCMRTVNWFEKEFDALKSFPELSAVTLACALEYLDFRHPEFDWRINAPQLRKWSLKQSKQQSMISTRPSD